MAAAAAWLLCRGRLRRLRPADHSCMASLLSSSGPESDGRQRKGRARRSAALTEAGWTSVHLDVLHRGRSGGRYRRRAGGTRRGGRPVRATAAQRFGCNK